MPRRRLRSGSFFTLETDGRLPSGQTLQAVIQTVDAQADKAPAYYMINCAHPTHFAAELDADAVGRAHRGLESECLLPQPCGAGCEPSI